MSDYTAWLIEIDEGGPTYFQMVDDDDWTRDHDKALHFSRKQDAEQVIAYYGWTRAKAVEHMWSEPSQGEPQSATTGACTSYCRTRPNVSTMRADITGPQLCSQLGHGVRNIGGLALASRSAVNIDGIGRMHAIHSSGQASGE